MSKLGIVTRHEYLTIIKQPSFWIVMFAMPLFIGMIFAISYFSSTSSEKRIDELTKELKNVAIIDESNIIRQDIVTSAGLSVSPPSELGTIKEQVRQEQKEALIVYPTDVAKTKKYEVYVSSNDFTKSGSVTGLADELLEASVFAPLGSSDLISLAKDGAESQVITYKDGRETAGINEYVIPALFVILFYIVFFFSVGYMLSSVGEEKENRSVEMVLTYVNSKTFIIGKLLAVILVTLTQLAFFGMLGLLGLLAFSALGNDFTLPLGIELSKIVYDPLAILFGFGFLFAGFMMYAGFMTITASAAPSTREANSFATVFYIGAFSPGWIFMMIVTDPENAMTKFASFFPLTSPATTLLRNTVGNIGPLEASLALAAMTLFAFLSIWLAIRTFRLGALEFSNRISIKSLFQKM